MCGKVVIVILLIACLVIQKKYRQQESEKNDMLEQYYLLKDYYADLIRETEKNRKYRHDIENHMVLIKWLDQNNDYAGIRRYQKELEGVYGKVKNYIYSNSPLIDALIKQKQEECQRNGVILDVSFLQFKGNRIKENDLYNLLKIVLMIIMTEVITAEGGYIHIELRNSVGNLLIWFSYLAEYFCEEAIKEKINKNMPIKKILKHYNGTLKSKKNNSEQQILLLLEYPERLAEQEQHEHVRAYCGIQLIDVMLHNKITICKRKAISVEYQIDKLELGKIEQVDALTLIFNLFDNAIAGCSHIVPLEKRYIKVKAGTSERLFCFDIINSIEPGKYRGEKNNEGTGLEIVRGIVAKYQGAIQIEEQEAGFFVSAILNK